MAHHNYIRCDDCWWFRQSIKQLNTDKGHCLQYGIQVKKNDQICCDFDR